MYRSAMHAATCCGSSLGLVWWRSSAHGVGCGKVIRSAVSSSGCGLAHGYGWCGHPVRRAVRARPAEMPRPARAGAADRVFLPRPSRLGRRCPLHAQQTPRLWRAGVNGTAAGPPANWSGSPGLQPGTPGGRSRPMPTQASEEKGPGGTCVVGEGPVAARLVGALATRAVLRECAADRTAREDGRCSAANASGITTPPLLDGQKMMRFGPGPPY